MILIGSYIVTDYIRNNYLTLLFLASLIILLIVNYSTKITARYPLCNFISDELFRR